MKTKTQLLKTVLQALKPIPKISLAEWANKYMILPAESAEPGKYHIERTPYAVDILNAFTQTNISKIVVMSSSQVAKSTILLIVLGRFAHVDPCPIMLIQPTDKLAEKFSKTRIQPMIDDVKVLRQVFYGESEKAKSRDKNQTISEKFFKGGHLILTGANSPSHLASQPIRILLCDEVDRFPFSAGKEGSPISLAEKRQTTYLNKITGLFSTPTIENASVIEVEYLAGTQEEWQYKCPNCGEYHILDWRQMITDYESVETKNHRAVLINSVKYQCPDCGNEFDELTMKKCPAKYISQNPTALKNGVRSFWLNAFSSPWLNWKDIMREWYEAKGDPSREAVVMNTRFGLSYRQTGEYDNENEFLEKRIDYNSELPNEVLLLTAAVDVQANRLEYEVVGWKNERESYGILRGIIAGEPTDYQTWLGLDTILDREYRYADGRRIKISRTFVDSGFCTQNVYEYCRLHRADNRLPIKGRSAQGKPLIIDYSQPKNSGVLLVTLNVDDGKQEIFSRLGAGLMKFPRDDIFFTKRGYDEVYFKQLIAEKRVMRRRNGVAYLSWEPVGRHARNESLDLAVYNLACMKSLNYNFEKPIVQPVIRKKGRITSRSIEMW